MHKNTGENFFANMKKKIYKSLHMKNNLFGIFWIPLL